LYVGGIVASEASRKNFDVPNNIIKRLHEKKNWWAVWGGLCCGEIAKPNAMRASNERMVKMKKGVCQPHGALTMR